MIRNLAIWPFMAIAVTFRKCSMLNKYLFMLVCLRQLQPAIAWMAPIQAYMVYKKAAKKCPAYKNFLHDNQPALLPFGKSFRIIPETNKENYVKKYSVEERCYCGKIPAKGTVIDESSGSSGVPNNWVRGPKDRAEVKKLLQYSLAVTYPKQEIFFINCFALGPWATGMNVSMSVAEVAVLKSIGPDEKKLENTLKTFGPEYRYVIVGYPPFIKLFVDNTSLDLKKYKLHLITGGEAISEGLREHLGQYFTTLISSYGASDLDINIGFETDYTLELRQICKQDRELTKKLFGREQLPMIFQYNPQDYYVEISQYGELIFTICRLSSAAPKVRYNIHDSGGAMTTAQITKILAESNKPVIKPKIHFPVLYVYGRADLSVAFYGAKIFSTDMDNILHTDKLLSASCNSFQLSVIEDKELKRFLKICLEIKEGKTLEEAGLNQMIFEKLKQVNQDFREVAKMFDARALIIELHPFCSGPFKGRDIRIKQKYIAT